MTRESDVARARSACSAATSVAVLTGAGISAESGVPTFRGQDGLWKSFRAEDLATPEAFDRDPALVWEWYGWRRARIAPARPNAGHRALVVLDERLAAAGGDFLLITQNVDGLHEAAGSKRMVRLHGAIWESRCLGCGGVREDRRTEFASLPACATCGGRLRPNVVWFGEGLGEDDLRRAVDAASECELFLVIGTSGVVQPAASLALMARRGGARVIEINPDETPLSESCDISLRGPAGEMLPRIIAAG